MKKQSQFLELSVKKVNKWGSVLLPWEHEGERKINRGYDGLKMSK